jgi:hypothetical protein
MYHLTRLDGSFLGTIYNQAEMHSAAVPRLGRLNTEFPWLAISHSSSSSVSYHRTLEKAEKHLWHLANSEIEPSQGEEFLQRQNELLYPTAPQ